MKTLLSLVLVLMAAPAFAAPPARAMYGAALQREQVVRTTLNAPAATAAVLVDVRKVVAAYESVVRRYPGSGYSDNALWQAGRLELDAFAKFGDREDREAGVRLLKKLASVYVSSKLARQVPEQLAHVSDVPAPPAPPRGASPGASPGQPVATIKGIRRAVLPDAVRITIEFDNEVAFHEERIAGPERVFLDLPGTRAVPTLVDRTLRFDGDSDVVRQIRVGRHPNNTTRIVLDANGVGPYSVYPLYSPFRLVIDCVRQPAATTGQLKARTEVVPLKPKTLSARVLPPSTPRRTPALSPRAATQIADARSAAEAPPKPVAEAAAKAVEAASRPVEPIAAVPPAPNSKGGYSIARQLGLGVSRIVIDPGHGGHDPGAKGKAGVVEAELVLDIALRVEKLLQKVPGVEVILTRRTDDFIPLQERTAIANREGADLFLSIHANASPNPQARGIETYFLNFANNLSAAQVAARENAASGQAMGALPDLVKAIALNNKLDESKDFAAEIQRAMLQRLRGSNRVVKDLGVKQAPFVVLIGAAMPSVLAEISFVTNTQEARLLKSNAYRQRIAEALFNAIRKYQTSLKNVTTVAHQ